MELKNNAHLVTAPIGAGSYNAFDLPYLFNRLQDQYNAWVKENAAELVAMMEHATSLHLMCATDDEDGESLELHTQVSHNDEWWMARIDRDGVTLIYADPDYEGTEGFLWGDMVKEPYLLGQIIADPAVRNLIA
jgi:hypothetical protein